MRPDKLLLAISIVFACLTAPVFAAGTETRQDRIEIQARLNELGFDVGTPDGIFGRKTEAAIRDYQSSIGVTPTGTLTSAQAEKLLGAGAAAVAKPAVQVKPGRVFRDCPNCPQMVEIPAGRFEMGQTEAELKHPYIGFVPSENPRHTVTIGYGFAIGRTEISVAEFGAYVKETGADVGGTCGIHLMETGPKARIFKGERHPDSSEEETGPFFVYITNGSYAQPGLAVTRSQPAVCVSRDEIEGYLDWLSKKTGRAYRLPTSAEFEYAARAGTQTIAFWGDDFAQACAYANFGDKASGYQTGLAAPCAESAKPDWTAKVGSYEPNPWGLYDMAGNARELVEDCWHADYTDTPADGSPWRQANCDLFTTRGGDYESLYARMRASERSAFGYDPQVYMVQGPDEARDVRENTVGFRVAVSLGPGAWDDAGN